MIVNISINSIKYNSSHVDGPGIRTVLFVQGCDIHCKGCHNKSAWDIRNGTVIDIDQLVDELNSKVFNKKITISGGEPLMQRNALLELVTKLDEEGFDIALYTGHKKEEVPQEILNRIRYLKYGEFVEDLKTAIKPFVGSSNQLFEEVRKNEAIK